MVYRKLQTEAELDDGFNSDEAYLQSVVSGLPTPAPVQQFIYGDVTLPEDWYSKSAADKISFFNKQNLTPDRLLGAGAGVTQADIDWMRTQGYTAGLSPAPAPAPAASWADSLPGDWNSLESAYGNIRYLNANQITPEQLKANGMTDAEITWMLENGYVAPAVASAPAAVDALPDFSNMVNPFTGEAFGSIDVAAATKQIEEDAAKERAVSDLTTQIALQWQQFGINPDIKGINRANELAQILFNYGITDLSKLGIKESTYDELVNAGYGGENAVDDWQTVTKTRGQLTYGDQTFGRLGGFGSRGEKEFAAPQEYLQQADPGSYGLGYSAAGKGWVEYELVPGPGGKPVIVPRWGSSSDVTPELVQFLSLAAIPFLGPAATALGGGAATLGSTMAANALVSGTIGGLGAVAQGGDFWDAALRSGATSALGTGIGQLAAPFASSVGADVLASTGSQTLADAATAAVRAGAGALPRAITTGDFGNVLTSALTAGASTGITAGVSELTGLSTKDINAAINFAQGAAAGDLSKMLSSASAFTNNPDIEVASKAVRLVQAIESGDPARIVSAGQAFGRELDGYNTRQTIEKAYQDPSRQLDTITGSKVRDAGTRTVAGIEDLVTSDLTTQDLIDILNPPWQVAAAAPAVQTATPPTTFATAPTQSPYDKYVDFGEAFRAARSELGAGQAFTWTNPVTGKTQTYTTDLAPTQVAQVSAGAGRGISPGATAADAAALSRIPLRQEPAAPAASAEPFVNPSVDYTDAATVMGVNALDPNYRPTTTLADIGQNLQDVRENIREATNTGGRLGFSQLAGTGLRAAEIIGSGFGTSPSEFAAPTGEVDPLTSMQGEPLSPDAAVRDVQKELYDYQKAQLAALPNDAQRAFASGIASTVNTVASYALGGPWATVANAAANTGNLAWMQGKEAGLSNEDNAKRSAFMAGVEAVGEAAGVPFLKMLFKGMPMTGSKEALTDWVATKLKALAEISLQKFLQRLVNLQGTNSLNLVFQVKLLILEKHLAKPLLQRRLLLAAMRR